MDNITAESMDNFDRNRAQDARLTSIVLAGGAEALYLSQNSFWSVMADLKGPFPT